MDITLKKLRKDALVFRKIKAKQEIKEEDKIDGYLIDADEKELRKILEYLKSKNEKKQIAVLGRNDYFNRRVLETCRINYLVSPEKGHNRDTLKQRDSGLNHVLAKIAKEKNISIMIDFSSLLNLEKKEKALVLSRIMQNIRICRKVSCHVKIATFAENKKQLRNEKELKAFAFSLGMSSQQVKEAFEF